jgi:hypothetical protein
MFCLWVSEGVRELSSLQYQSTSSVESLLWIDTYTPNKLAEAQIHYLHAST